MPDSAATISLDDDGSRLVVTGEIDEPAAVSLREAIHAASKGFAAPLVVDVSAVTYLPSVAVGVLATSRQAARAQGQTLELTAAAGSIAQRVLEVCALPHRTH